MDIKKLRKLIRETLQSNNEVVCYHRSNDYKHMVNNNFSLTESKDVALFGNAIYFSETSNTSSQLGKYVCKFGIKLKNPVLDMNQTITNEEAGQLLLKFNQMFNKKIDIDFNDMYDGVQYGEFFGEISELYSWDLNQYYQKFIKSLGFNSFKYFGTFHTDFSTERGDYGLCYGIYDPKDVRFIDGPF